jgi:hypothetical protein
MNYPPQWPSGDKRNQHTSRAAPRLRDAWRLPARGREFRALTGHRRTLAASCAKAPAMVWPSEHPSLCRFGIEKYRNS